MKVRRTTGALVAAGALALAVTGCSSSNGTSSAAMPAAGATSAAAMPTTPASGSASAMPMPARGPAAIGGAPVDAPASSPPGSDEFVSNGDVAPPGAPRVIISTAQLTVEAKNVPEAVGSVGRIALEEGGRIDAQKVANRADGGHDATIVLKVPPEKYDDAIAKLSGLGTQRALDQTTQDVTGNVTDLESRVATEAKSIKRIQAFMDKATTIKDLVTLEGELTAREATLESQQKQANALRGQAAMGTITATFVEPNVIPAVAPKPVHRSGFSAGLHNGWHAFTATVVVLMTAAGALAPFAVPALLALAIWILVRRRRRGVEVIAPPNEPVTT